MAREREREREIERERRERERERESWKSVRSARLIDDNDDLTATQQKRHITVTFSN